MDITTLRKFQYDTIERLYRLIDESVLLTATTDVKETSNEVRRITKALTAELEGMEEVVKEFNDI